MENQENKVRVENLTKYFGDLHVLDGVSFNIRKGEFLCVVGPVFRFWQVSARGALAPPG